MWLSRTNKMGCNICWRCNVSPFLRHINCVAIRSNAIMSLVALNPVRWSTKGAFPPRLQKNYVGFESQIKHIETTTSQRRSWRVDPFRRSFEDLHLPSFPECFYIQKIDLLINEQRSHQWICCQSWAFPISLSINVPMLRMPGDLPSLRTTSSEYIRSYLQHYLRPSDFLRDRSTRSASDRKSVV